MLSVVVGVARPLICIFRLNDTLMMGRDSHLRPSLLSNRLCGIVSCTLDHSGQWCNLHPVVQHVGSQKGESNVVGGGLSNCNESVGDILGSHVCMHRAGLSFHHLLASVEVVGSN